MEIPPASASASASVAVPSPSKPKRILAVHHKTMVRGTRASELRAEKAAAAAAAAAAAGAAAKSSSGTSTPIPSAPSTARSSLAHLPPNTALSATLPVPPVKAAAAAAPGDVSAPSLSQTASSAALKSKGVGVKKVLLKPRYATMKPSVSAALTAAAATASASSHPVLLTHANSGKLASGTLSNRLTAPTASSAAKMAPEPAKTVMPLEPHSSVVLSDANPSPTALGPSASASSGTATHAAPATAPPAAATAATLDKLAVPPLTLAPATSSPKLRPSLVHSNPAPRASNGTASTGVPPRHSTSRTSRPPSANAHASSASASSAAASSSSAIAASSRLSLVDREVLSDIALIQDWLSSIKASKRSNLLNFKETICAMKKVIFTPQQVARARKAPGNTTNTAAATGTKSGSSSTKKTAAAKGTMTAAQRAAVAAANALLSPLQRKLARLTATPLMTHFDFSTGDVAALAVPPAADRSSADHSDAETISSASALPARASPPLLDGFTRDADDDSDYGDDFDPAVHADASSSGGGGGSGGVGDDEDEFDSKLSSFLRKTTKRDEDFIRDSTLSGQGQFAHVSSVVFENGRWIPKSESVMQHAGGAATASSKSMLSGASSSSAANQLGSDLDEWGSETDQPAPADDDDENALDHIPDFSSSRAMDNDDPTSNSPSSVSQKQATYRPGSGMGTITASSRMRSSSNSQSTKRTSTRTGTLSRTSRATSSAISPAFDDTSDAVSVSMSGRSDSPSHLTSFGGDATSPSATASSKAFPSSSPSSVSQRQTRPDDLDDLDAIPDFDSEPPSAADHKIVAPQPTVPTPTHAKANSAIVAPFPFAAQGQAGSNLALSPASHQKSRSIGFIPASSVNAVAPTVPPTVITVQSWTKNSAAPFAPVATAAPLASAAAAAAAAAAPTTTAASSANSSTLLKKSVAADNDFPDDLDGLDDDDDDQPVQQSSSASRPPPLKQSSLTSSSGSSKMQTFTSMPVPGSKTLGAPGHVLTSSASLDDDDALELQLESRAMLSPASTTRSTLRSSGMGGGSGLDSEPDSASTNGPSSSSSSSGPVNHSSRISLFSKALVKGSSHAEDDFPSDLDDLSDTEFEDEDRTATAATLAASAPSAAAATSLGKAARELNEFALTPALQATFSASEDAHQAALMGKLSAFTSPEAAAAPLHAHVLSLLRRDDAITPALRAAYVNSDLYSQQFQATCAALLAEAAAGAKALHASRRHTYAGAKLVVPGGHQRGRSESGASDSAGRGTALGNDATKVQQQ